MNIITMILEMINPLNYFVSWVGVFDVMSFFVIPYIFVRDWFKCALIYTGFMITQISMPQTGNLPYLEWFLELAGLSIIIMTCVSAGKEEQREQDAKP